MTAWLRRKDYNPMKAAAEAKKLQQLKARLVFLRKMLDKCLRVRKYAHLKVKTVVTRDRCKLYVVK